MDDPGFGQTFRPLQSGAIVFRRYRLDRVLGHGGMGQVWLAEDEKLGKSVALKFLPDAVRHDPVAVDELKRETRRGQDLRHPHIVAIYDFVEGEGKAAIAMEFVAGRTLSELRLEQPNRVFEADDRLKSWLKEIVDALTYAHEKAKMVHRDLKPSNLMVDETSGEIKIADFGIARTLGDSASHMTRSQIGIEGSLPYMSPQQLLGELPSPSDDIYGFGATLYELLTGKPPFYMGNLELQIREKVPPTMYERRRELEIEGGVIPDEWERMVAACLAKDGAARPKTVVEFLAGLKAKERREAIPLREGNEKGEGAKFRRSEVTGQPGFAEVLIELEPTTGSQRQPVPSERRESGGGSRRITGKAIAIVAVLAIGGFAAWQFIKAPEKPRSVERAQSAPPPEHNVKSATEKEEGSSSMSTVGVSGETADQPAVERSLPTIREKKTEIPLKSGGISTERMWIEAATGKEILAEFVRLEEGAVILKMGGRLTSTPLERLSVEDQEFVRNSVEIGATLIVAEPLMPEEGTANPALASKERPFVNSLGMKFVPVAIGAGPTKDQTVLFSIWETRVQDYAAYATENPAVDDRRNWVGQEAYHPVRSVGLEDAKAFCAWLTPKERAAGLIGPGDEYRLPTDVEWSYAVGIGDREDPNASPEDKSWTIKGVYPWGTAWPPPIRSGNFDAASIDGFEDDHATIAPVGSYSANEKGIYDLGGNLWEWCEDCYYSTDLGNCRVLRGGSWDVGTKVLLWSSYRVTRDSGGGIDEGFRVVVVVGG